ncbi:MAG: D-alanyl-D-alanine carboxypeptidase family protein [bacterium]
MVESPKGKAVKGWFFLMLLVLALGMLNPSPLALAQENQDPKASKTSTQPKKKNSTTSSKTSQAQSVKTRSLPKTSSKPNSSAVSKSSSQAKLKTQSVSSNRSSNGSKGRSTRRAQAPALEPFKAAVVMDAASGKLVYAHDPHKKLVPASLTKMMLVLVVMEKVRAGKLRLSEPVTASERTTGVGGTQIDLKPGETLPLEEMLQAILVRSANDAAATVAEHVSGSQARFVELMNQKARALGMFDTVFTNVHGLPEPNGHDNVSTAYDMAVLAKALLRFPEVLHWSSQEVAFIRAGRYPIHTTNKLLGRCEGVDGLKTGFVRKAGFNIAATAAREHRRLIAVVMGSPSSETRNNSAASLLSQGFNDKQAGNTSVKKEGYRESTRSQVSRSTQAPSHHRPNQLIRS